MKIEEKRPPRRYTVGKNGQVEIEDCGRVALAPDEQLTFVTEAGAEYDLTRKDWGFYATPSLNGRLPSFGLRAVLIVNRDTKRYFVLLVEDGKEALFERYLEEENLAVVLRLDDPAALERLADEAGVR